MTSTPLRSLALNTAWQSRPKICGARVALWLGSVTFTSPRVTMFAPRIIISRCSLWRKLAELKQGIAAVSAKMGNLHYAQGNFAQAMEHYLKSVRLYEELGSKIEITYPLANLGNAYFALGNYEKALEHYQKILKIYEQLSSKSGAAWLRNQIADVYAAQGKNEPALAYYDLSLKAHEELGNKPMQAYSLNGIGRIRFTEGKYAEAIRALHSRRRSCPGQPCA